MPNLMLWNPSNRCQWPVSKVSLKKLIPSYLTRASKYAQNFGSVTGMWPCVHLEKIVYHSHPAATCQKAILRFNVHWHAYYGINTNKILKKLLGCGLSWTIFGFVRLAWRKLAFRTQLFLVPHSQRNQPIIIPERIFSSQYVPRWHSKKIFEKNWPLPSCV